MITREQIESLGFKFENQYSVSTLYYWKDPYIVGGGFLEYRPVKGNIHISIYKGKHEGQGDPVAETVFKGYCETFEELKLLIKMIRLT